MVANSDRVLLLATGKLLLLLVWREVIPATVDCPSAFLVVRLISDGFDHGNADAAHYKANKLIAQKRVCESLLVFLNLRIILLKLTQNADSGDVAQ